MENTSYEEVVIESNSTNNTIITANNNTISESNTNNQNEQKQPVGQTIPQKESTIVW